MGSSHEATHRKIKSRRAKLPLVVAIGRKFMNREGIAAVLQSLNHGTIDLRVALPALLVVDGAGIAYTSQYQSMFDPG